MHDRVLLTTDLASLYNILVTLTAACLARSCQASLRCCARSKACFPMHNSPHTIRLSQPYCDQLHHRRSQQPARVNTCPQDT